MSPRAVGAQDPHIATQGLLHGFTAATWGVVAANAFGGMLVAITIKYADNILRGFAQAVAIIVGAIGSYVLFDFVITGDFVAGVGFVTGARSCTSLPRTSLVSTNDDNVLSSQRRAAAAILMYGNTCDEMASRACPTRVHTADGHEEHLNLVPADEKGKLEESEDLQ